MATQPMRTWHVLRWRDIFLDRSDLHDTNSEPSYKKDGILNVHDVSCILYA